MKKLLTFLAIILLPISAFSGGVGFHGVGKGGGGDTTKPTIDSASVNTAGTQLTITFSESCSRGAGFAASQFTFNDGSANALTYLSGDPGTSWVFTTANTVHSGDTCTLAFDGGATSILDGAGNYADDDASITVTNNSTQSGGEPNLVLAGDTTDRSAGSDHIQTADNALVYCYPGGTGGYNGTAGTLRYGYLRTGDNLTASNIKMVVYTKSGSTWSLLETSTPRSFVENSLIEFAFSGSQSIPAGTGNVIIAFIADGYFNVKVGGSSWQMAEDFDGTYVSPPSTITPDDDCCCCGYGRLMEIFVTNYQR